MTLKRTSKINIFECQVRLSNLIYLKKMRKILFCMAIVCMSFEVFSQEIEEDAEKKIEKNSITIGILQGGGSLVGVDYEVLLFDSFGIQAGAGWVGFGGGLDFHLKPSIRSSFFSLQYWHQGFANSYTQSVLGSNFVFRGKRWFTFQIGLGYALDKGPAWPSRITQPSAMLTYAIGGYIPW